MKPPVSTPFSSNPAADAAPEGTDRRAFLMRSAVIGAAAVMTGCDTSREERTAQAAKEAAAPPQPRRRPSRRAWDRRWHRTSTWSRGPRARS